MERNPGLASTAEIVTHSLAPPVASWLDRTAGDWRLSKNAIVGIILLPFAIALLAVLHAAMGKVPYKVLVAEDQLGEYLQVGFYLGALALGMIVTGRLYRGGHKGIAALYVLVCLGIVFIVGEELSWGQRLFGVETADWIRDVNKQGENTIHNIRGVNVVFKWIHVLIGAYGLFLPLALRNKDLASHREMATLLVPHLILVPYFVFEFLWRLQALLWEPAKQYRYTIHEYNEVIELILAIAIFLFMVYQLRRRDGSRRGLRQGYKA